MLDDLRAHFPVLERIAYLNAGTNGPLPRESVQAAERELEKELRDGRWIPAFEHRQALQDELRGELATMTGSNPGEVALTSSTSEGLAKVLLGLDLRPGDEIVSSDSEHPGLLGPLRAARDRGIDVRLVAFGEVARAVGPRTKLVAVSHVSWVDGSLAPIDELADCGVPVVYDGAQALGAIRFELPMGGAIAYAAPGQKWLCGSEDTGALWIHPDWTERISSVSPSYTSYASTTEGLESPLHPDARRFDAPVLSTASVAMTLTSVKLLRSYDALDHAQDLAEALAAELGDRVRPRARSTLVAIEADDTATVLERADAASVLIREIPGEGVVRVSVGPWTNRSDIDRLLACLR